MVLRSDPHHRLEVGEEICIVQSGSAISDSLMASVRTRSTGVIAFGRRTNCPVNRHGFDRNVSGRHKSNTDLGSGTILITERAGRSRRAPSLPSCLRQRV